MAINGGSAKNPSTPADIQATAIYHGAFAAAIRATNINIQAIGADSQAIATDSQAIGIYLQTIGIYSQTIAANIQAMPANIGEIRGCRRAMHRYGQTLAVHCQKSQ